ncbi:MAG: tRNA1(Val) (adenine(37)-N6)-methyltransferase [Bacilli bacterium]
MEVIHELLGYKNIKIIQNSDMFSFSGDSMLLAYFINTYKKLANIIDLGCGNGPIPLYLTLKTKAKIIGVEIQTAVSDMASRSVELNGLTEQIKIINADIKNIYKQVGANKFDVVVCNPPYFKYKPSSNINKNDYLTIARHEVKITLEDIVAESNKLLLDGGSLCMIHRVDRLAEIISVLDKYNFAIKRMQFVYPKQDSTEALQVLIEAKNNAKCGMKVLKPFYMYDINGEYTKEALTVFNLKNCSACK